MKEKDANLKRPEFKNEWRIEIPNAHQRNPGGLTH
jgi:hypothetical protein